MLGERQKLAEVVKHHQINHNRGPAQPEGMGHYLQHSCGLGTFANMRGV